MTAQSIEGQLSSAASNMPRRRSRLQAASDDRLLVMVHHGDSAAFAELYQRHHPDALRYATRLTRRYLDRDSGDDVLAEAVRRMLSALHRGKGPVIGFRQYLFTAVRSVTFGERTTSHQEIVDDPPDERRPALEERLDAMVAMDAFMSLPVRWQHALWTTKVCGMTPQEIAKPMGLRAHTVTVTTIRAREALRIAYVRAHLPRPQSRPCRRVVDLLARRAVVAITTSQQRLLGGHLTDCDHCGRAADDLDLELASWDWTLGTNATVESLRLADDAEPGDSLPVVLALGA